MHLGYALLLVVTTFLACVSASLTSDLPTVFQPIADEVNAFSSSRLLRSHEERGIPVSTIGNIKSKFMPSTISEKTLRGWLNGREKADDVFVWLSLGRGKGELFNKRKFGTWVKYVDDLTKQHPGSGISTISKLTSYYGDEHLSQMIIAAQKNPKTRALAADLQARQLQYWLDNKKAPAKVFKLLELNKAGGNLVDNPQVSAWLSYVADFETKFPKQSEKAIPMLTRRFGDEAVSKALLKAKQTPGTASIADKLHDVFKFLTLNKAGEQLLENPQFATWLTYVDDFNTKNPPISRISVVASSYGDEALSKLLREAKQVPRTANIANKLDGELIQHWTDTKTLPKTMFKLLELNRAGDKLLENSQFATWLTYVDDFYSRNPRNPRVSIMTSYYGDEALTRLLIKAMQTPSEAYIATKLHEEQLQSWIYSRKLPGDVFKFLSLDKAGEKLFDHPQFMKWVKYVEDLNKVHPDKKTTLMSVLARQYDSEGLVKLLQSAKNNPSWAKLVQQLETEQKWMAKGTPNDYFKQLKLDKVGKDVLSNPQLKTWLNYVKEYNAANPKYQATLIGTLAANYGEMKLVKMLDEAMKVKDTASAAKKLQSELFQRWIQLNWTPEYIFAKVLRLDQEGDVLFTNPLVVTWGKYLSAFNRYNHGEETTIWMVLEATGYKIEELQRMVDRLPEQLFTMLRLGNKGDSLLTSPQLANWIQYLDNFYVTFPDMGKTMMKTVREYYHDISLVDMIVSAMKASSTEKIAKRMELELFRNWHAVSHKTPDDIFQILELDETGSMLLASPLLDMWIRYLTAFNKQTPSEKTSIIGTFLKYYDESELSLMIITAKGNTNAEKLASNLEDALSLYKSS